MIGTIYFLELVENINYTKNHVDRISFNIILKCIAFQIIIMSIKWVAI